MSRETLDVDILIVGAGPAGLAAALRVSQLQKASGGEPLSIAVIEKGREAGAHMLSGAVLDPSSLAELVPDFDLAASHDEDRGPPVAVPEELLAGREGQDTRLRAFRERRDLLVREPRERDGLEIGCRLGHARSSPR